MSFTVVSLIVVAVAVLAITALFRDRALSRSERLCRLFNLDPDKYELLGSDLGGGSDKIFLRGYGLSGVSDAVFRRRSDGHIIVGEAKSRRYRGAVTRYERFQVTLYIGLAERKYRTHVSAVMRYGCGTTVPVLADSDLFRELLALLPEYRRVSRELKIA